MKGRHRVALLAVFAALVLFYRGSQLEPRWFWTSTYWVLIAIALVAVLRRGPRMRRR